MTGTPFKLVRSSDMAFCESEGSIDRIIGNRSRFPLTADTPRFLRNMRMKIISKDDHALQQFLVRDEDSYEGASQDFAQPGLYHCYRL